MNVNFGLFQELPPTRTKKLTKDDRKLAFTSRAKKDWNEWFQNTPVTSNIQTGTS